MATQRRPHRFHVSWSPPPQPAAGSDAVTNYSILFNNVEFDLIGHRYPYRSFIDVMTMNLQQRYCKDQHGTEGSSPSPSPHTISLISCSFLDNLVKLHEEEANHIIFIFCIVFSYIIILEVRVKICKN